jgi:hypothetical protein
VSVPSQPMAVGGRVLARRDTHMPRQGYSSGLRLGWKQCLRIDQGTFYLFKEFIQHAVLYGFREMGGLHILAFLQIGYGAGHF